MGKSRLLSLRIYLLLMFISLPDLVVSLPLCYGPCETTPSPQPGGCEPGTLTCSGTPFPTYDCSPPVTSSTPAKLTNNDFSDGGDGGDVSDCDKSYHSNNERIVALSTGWYNKQALCNQTIRIWYNNRSVDAKVVDECDSMKGCDKEHAYQAPCNNNTVDGSNAVWEELGLSTEDGEADITWSMA